MIQQLITPAPPLFLKDPSANELFDGLYDLYDFVGNEKNYQDDISSEENICEEKILKKQKLELENEVKELKKQVEESSQKISLLEKELDSQGKTLTMLTNTFHDYFQKNNQEEEEEQDPVQEKKKKRILKEFFKETETNLGIFTKSFFYLENLTITVEHYPKHEKKFWVVLYVGKPSRREKTETSKAIPLEDYLSYLHKYKEISGITIYKNDEWKIFKDKVSASFPRGELPNELKKLFIN